MEMINGVSGIYIHDQVYSYMVRLMKATRENEYIELGVSPRGTIAMSRIVRAWAFLQGREYVIPGDVSDLFMDIAKHRIVLSTRASATRVTEEEVLSDILKTVNTPSVSGGKKRRKPEKQS